MTLGSTPTIPEILAEISQTFPYTFPDARTRWLAEVGASDPITFPTSFANKQSVKVVASVADAGGSSPHTFSAANFGIAFSDRVLIACTCLRGNGSSGMNISAVTIGGVAAVGNDNGEFLAGGPCIGTGIFAAAVPSGTSGDVVVTWGGQSANASGLILLSVSGISTTAFAQASQVFGGSGGTSANNTINVPSNGLLIVNSGHSNGNDTTLTGVTERTALTVGTARFEVGFDNRMSSETARAISASWSGSAARGFQARSYSQG
ncbi:hypothetical protein EOA79_04570 [Mesorhizobium sp. M1A.F.Ca.IN.020.03.2.1]|uniref:hypothetical protein n=1 Tax=Mesorhizobium sp. M1A.F.Ca.IN.020.03.2.1 TaxID=2496769 RepID=UPI000FD59EB0|nr:hypothetical protein [Mesorhizobium sp. M1A.F.Ca.IN.020.03.2.1]RUV07445.1 hypothetical protein EOA79_04570 [Mesorhizobium sp. M1A.F.Ca.IN.020.03.2.1]